MHTSLESIMLNMTIGDVIEFSTLPYTILNNRKFTVTGVTSADFSHVWNFIFSVRSDDLVLYISMDRMGKYISLSHKISLEDAEGVFYGIKTPHPWTDSSYAEEPVTMEGILYDEDHRIAAYNNPSYAPSIAGRKFTYESYSGISGNHLLDIEIFGSNDIEAYLTTLLPAHESIEHITGWRQGKK